MQKFKTTSTDIAYLVLYKIYNNEILWATKVGWGQNLHIQNKHLTFTGFVLAWKEIVIKRWKATNQWTIQIHLTDPST